MSLPDTAMLNEHTAASQAPIQGLTATAKKHSNTAIAELRQVTRLFPGPPQVLALNEVDLTITHGDYLAIVGPSGSGKSTMLNTLGLLDRPNVGQYFFEGVDTGELREDERAALRSEAIGFVFQAFHLLPRRTVLENVMLAGIYNGTSYETRKANALQALERVRLTHRLNFTPATLSGGERQRVAIARAIANSPRLLLADEPTGNLDRRNSEAVLELFQQLGQEGLTIVMITHDDYVAEAAKRRVKISDGKLTVMP